MTHATLRIHTRWRRTFDTPNLRAAIQQTVPRHATLTLRPHSAPRPWPLRSVISTGASAHAKPVSCVLYNPQFREAVTGDHEGVVCVWDVATGNMRFRFQDAHG